ncbi:MAG TPA: tRNA (adenosine(37)-N6)-threonylcarbamoyltransferase complex dimerization subunit type 1 TsaB [Saprospiraceae bacterium]|nr:tRNA (adenosine(37)-N6)-threonylcarbamoyltransferase complex dimerization subunit type 1 TsaB [Saprospiraceae bacterium]
MYILHIETSTMVCSVALSKGKSVLDAIDLQDGMNHAALLAPTIERLLQSNSVKPSDLDAIAVCSGPGSYTGLRVGSATAKAMAYSLGKPLIAIPTLQALAQAAFDLHPEAEYALPMIDARRREVYTAIYSRSLEEVIPVSSVILTEEFFNHGIPVSGMIVSCGDGSLKIGEIGSLTPGLLVDTSIICSARHMVALAADAYMKGIFEDPLHFVPHYLKPPNITEPKKA